MLINKENYSMLKILLIALSCFFAFGSFGQELTIKRDSQIKSFKENSVYFIVLSKVKSYKKTAVVIILKHWEALLLLKRIVWE